LSGGTPKKKKKKKKKKTGPEKGKLLREKKKVLFPTPKLGAFYANGLGFSFLIKEVFSIFAFYLFPPQGAKNKKQKKIAKNFSS